MPVVLFVPLVMHGALTPVHPVNFPIVPTMRLVVEAVVAVMAVVEA